MLLHTLNTGTRDTLQSCLRAALPGSALLLIEDGVHAAVADGESAALLSRATGLRVYALREDCEARGLADALAAEVELVDYTGFVRLSVAAHAVQSWH